MNSCSFIREVLENHLVAGARSLMALKVINHIRPFLAALHKYAFGVLFHRPPPVVGFQDDEAMVEISLYYLPLRQLVFANLCYS